MTIDAAIETVFGSAQPDMRAALEPQVHALFEVCLTMGGEPFLEECAAQLAMLRESCQSGNIDAAREQCITAGADPTIVDMALEQMRPYAQV